ncbi:MAG: hypothetical protein AB7I30_07130, partial [Isosphaeraceae bacterium]
TLDDFLYNIGVSSRVWDGDRCLGLFVANVTLGSRLVLLDMAEEPEGAAVVSPIDWSYAPPGSPPPSRRPPYLAAFHQSYSRAEVEPIWPARSRYDRLDDFERDPALRAVKVAFQHGGVTDYHRVGDTPLVVLTYQSYPRPARWLFNAKVAALGLVSVVAVGLVGYRWRRGRRKPRSNARVNSRLVVTRPDPSVQAPPPRVDRTPVETTVEFP